MPPKRLRTLRLLLLPAPPPLNPPGLGQNVGKSLKHKAQTQPAFQQPLGPQMTPAPFGTLQKQLENPQQQEWQMQQKAASTSTTAGSATTGSEEGIADAYAV
jgi:hypothetical protein